MDAVALIRRLHQHRQWVNRRLLEAAAELSNDRLHQPFEMGQGSIWYSLTHLYAAEYVWLEALLGNQDPLTPGDVPGRLPGNQAGDEALQNLLELRAKWSQLDRRWQAYLDDLTPAALANQVYKKSSLSGQIGATRCSDILLHVCTHAQYTTAQLVNMLRHVGVEPLPDPMLITLARQELADG